MSTLKVNNIGKTSGSTQDTMAGMAKVWGQIQQTSTQTVHGSFNISSITDTNTSRTEVNYTNAMSDANYSATSSGAKDWDSSPSGNQCLIVGAVYSTTGDSYFQSTQDTGSGIDSPRFMMAVNGDLA